MPKSLPTFINDMRRLYPSEVAVAKTVNPLTYDVSAIVKHLGALKKFPVLIFDHPLNGCGRRTDRKLVISPEKSCSIFPSTTPPMGRKLRVKFDNEESIHGGWKA